MVFAALLNALFFVLFFVLATSGYETNDDLSMQLIASGFYTGQPSEYLVFTNILIGWPLRLLYSLCNEINWYFAYLLTVQYVSLTAIAFVIFSRKRNWSFLLLYAGFFLLVEVRILLKLQFTTTAFIAGAAGMLLLVDGLESGRPVQRLRTLSGIGLIILMGMIREEVVLFLAILSLPFLIERFGTGGWRRLIGAATVCGALLFVVQGVNRSYYERDPEWSEFSTYNKLRGQVHGTPLAALASRAGPAAGWSANDADMFARFYFAEPEVYAGVSKLRHFVDALKDVAKSEPNTREFSARQLFLPKVLDRDSSVLTVVALLNAAWCLFVAGTNQRRCFLTFATIYGISVGLAFYLLSTARLPPRVAYNLPVFMNLVCLYWASTFGGSPVTYSPKGVGVGRLFSLPACAAWILIYGFVVVGMAQNLMAANTYYSRLVRTSARIFEPVKGLLPPGEQPLLVAMPYDSILEQCLLYRPPNDAMPFSLVPYGWLSHSPLFRQILGRHKLEPYSLSLIKRPDVFFLMGEGWKKSLTRFYHEHYGLEVTFESVINTDTISQFRECHLQLFRANSTNTNRLEPAAKTADRSGGAYSIADPQ